MSYFNRRNFLKTTLASAGIAGFGVSSCSQERGPVIPFDLGKNKKQRFNMCGYAAPKLDVVRIGFIGLGMRGPGSVMRMSRIDGVEIAALGDVFPERVTRMQERLQNAGVPKAKEYSGSEDAWKDMCEDPEIDLIYILTPWSLHAPMAIYAMECGKHAAVEVPAVLTVEEAWKLVETSEKTQKHCMMLENCCYDFFELTTLNMAQKGFFGEIVHTEGAYIHELVELIFSKEGYADMWRLKENQKDGNLYPTHGLGPVCQVMDINRGNKMEYLTSMSTIDFQLGKEANKLAESDSFYEPFAAKSYGGNMNTSLIRTHRGSTIMVQHDVTSIRPYSRIHLISGTKGIARKWPDPPRISTGHRWMSEEELNDVFKEYTPEIVRRVGEIARRIGGHGGMDFIMDWRLIDSLRNGLPLDQDVYDAALWSVITPLSRWSIENRSNSIDVPDFTCGSWQANKPVDLSLEKGGTTGVKDPRSKAVEQLEL